MPNVITEVRVAVIEEVGCSQAAYALVAAWAPAHATPAVVWSLHSRGSSPVVLAFPQPSGDGSVSAATSEELKKRIKDVVDPVADGFQVVGLHKIHQGGVALQVSSKEQVPKLSVRLAGARLKVSEPTAWDPRVKVIDVPRDVATADLPTVIYD